MASGLFLTSAERLRMQSFPSGIEREDLAAYFTLTKADQLAVRRRRGDRSRLGFAVMLCAIRYLGFVPMRLGSVPAEALAFVADQLGCRPDIEGYARRDKTRTDHATHAIHHVGFRRPTARDLRKLKGWLIRQARAHARPSTLLADACERLLRLELVRPGVTVLERLVLDARQQAEAEDHDALSDTLSPAVCLTLERLLKVDAALGATRLSWLRERARTNSPKSILMMLDKHAWLVAQRVTDWDVGSLHPNRLRYLARLGRTADAQAIGRMPEQRRHPVLLASLRQSLVDITDELLDMFSQCLVETRARARRAMLAHRQAAQQARDEIVASFATIARVLTDPDVPDESVRTTIADKVPKETLARLLEACEGQARPLDTEGLDFLRGRYAYLRQFSARFLGQMRIHGNPDETPVLSAVTAIREADTESRRRLPDDATTDFIPGRWEPFVLKDPGVDRAYYEMCALWTLRGALRSGQIWVEHSRRYAPASSYVLPKVEWNAQRADTLGLLGVSGESSEGLARKAERLRTLSQSVREAADHGPLAITDGVIAVPPLDAEPRPPSLVALEKAIDRRLPQVQMSELIVEVDRWTDFTGHLTHRSNEAAPSDRTRRVLYAALLAQATNMGFTRMALATNRTFEQLAWASTWHLAEPTLQAAFGTLVDFQHAQAHRRALGRHVVVV